MKMNLAEIEEVHKIPFAEIWKLEEELQRRNIKKSQEKR